MARRYTSDEAVEIMLKNHLKPLTPYSNTQTPWKSKCLICKKEVQPRLQKVLLRGHQCQYCSNHVTDSKDANKLMMANGFKPLINYPGSNKPWKSQCKKCGKVTSPSYTSVKRGIGCKFCSNRAVDSKDAERRMKERGFKVLEDFPGATADWKVQCLVCKKIFTTKFHSMKTNNGCKYCSGVAVLPNELEQRLKELKLLPLEPYVSAKTPWKCKCQICGHVVQPTWMRIKQKRGHCAYCANRRVDISEALKLMKLNNLQPLVGFPGTNKKWQCKCLKCGELVKPRFSDIRRGQGGCSNCADFGLNYSKEGYLYLISNSKYASGKIGIANTYKRNISDDRLMRHQKNGWILEEKYDFKKLSSAYDLEQEVLKWLRMNVNVPIHLSSKEMPVGGWTETFSLKLIDLSSVKKVLENKIEFKNS